MNVLIIEDNKEDAQQLKEIIYDLGVAEVAVATSFDETIQLNQQQQFDFYFIDIDLGETKTGFDVAQRLREKSKKAPIVFITAYFSSRNYNLAKACMPNQFLDKPISKLKIKQALELSLLKQPHQKITDRSEKFLYTKVGKMIRKIKFADILWVEVDGRYSKVIARQREYHISMHLKSLMEYLPQEQFLRIHQSYVINKEQIEALSLVDNYILLNDQRLPIGRMFKNAVKGVLNII